MNQRTCKINEISEIKDDYQVISQFPCFWDTLYAPWRLKKEFKTLSKNLIYTKYS